MILLADHAQTPVHRGLPLAELLAREWSVLQPSESRPELAQLAVSPTGRAAHVYLLPGEGERADPDAVRRALSVIEGVDLVCRLEDAGGRAAAASRAAGAPAEAPSPWSNAAGDGCASAPASDAMAPTCAAAAGSVEGDLEALEAQVEDGRLRSETYPDPLARVWSALSSPHAGDFLLSLAPGYEAVDWGGVTHAGGGSHGSLHAGDSLGPLLFVGCGPSEPSRARAVGAARRGAGRARALRPMRWAGRGRSSLPRRSAAFRPRPRARDRCFAGASRAATTQGRQGAASQRGLTHSATKVDGNWEVAYFADEEQVALVIVDPLTGLVRESWTGYQVAWKMARGYSGAFGHKLNAPYVFLPLCAIFLLGLLDWRRLRRVANLDLLVLLAFGASHFFFNRAEVGVSVPLQYLPLALPLRPGPVDRAARQGEGVRPIWPATWLLIAALFLVGFRVGLNVADSGAIDVGYAGVVGADRIAHGEPIYDNFPDDVSQGDTYGPVNYFAYVPFERIWPWSGSWDDLPAAHGAAVFFDLATFALLIFLGRRIRPGPQGNKLAATLAFGWAAYPYTAFALLSNSNDTLVAMLLVATLLALARPAARGVMAALATLRQVRPRRAGADARHLRTEATRGSCSPLRLPQRP